MPFYLYPRSRRATEVDIIEDKGQTAIIVDVFGQRQEIEVAKSELLDVRPEVVQKTLNSKPLIDLDNIVVGDAKAFLDLPEFRGFEGKFRKPRGTMINLPEFHAFRDRLKAKDFNVEDIGI